MARTRICHMYDYNFDGLMTILLPKYDTVFIVEYRENLRDPPL